MGLGSNVHERRSWETACPIRALLVPVLGIIRARRVQEEQVLLLGAVVGEPEVPYAVSGEVKRHSESSPGRRGYGPRAAHAERLIVLLAWSNRYRLSMST